MKIYHRLDIDLPTETKIIRHYYQQLPRHRRLFSRPRLASARSPRTVDRVRTCARVMVTLRPVLFPSEMRNRTRRFAGGCWWGAKARVRSIHTAASTIGRRRTTARAPLHLAVSADLAMRCHDSDAVTLIIFSRAPKWTSLRSEAQIIKKNTCFFSSYLCKTSFNKKCDLYSW